MKPFTEEDRYLYDLTPDSLVIDAGAHKGDFTAEIVRRYDCRVIALEPVVRFYEKVALRFFDAPKVSVVNAAIGAWSYPQHVFIKGDSSGFFADSQECDIASTWAVKEHLSALPPVDLLKLNVEGAEFEVLSHCLAYGGIDRLKNIQVQFHSVVPNAEALYDTISGGLLKTHHLTFDAGPWVWQNYRLNE